jgi:general secretion pathway protein C
MDAWLKRNFWIVIAALGGVASWSFAAGTMQLVAAKYLPLDPETFRGGASRGPVAASSAPSPRQLSAKSILESNPFDSVTGPIRESLPIPVMNAPPVDDGRERLFQQCSGLPRLTATVVDPVTPRFSFAVFSAGDGANNKPMAREGGNIGGKEVAVIVREKVYFHEGASYCYAAMFEPPKAAPPAPSAAPQPGGAPPPGDGPSRVPADIEKGIQKVDETNFNIDRTVVDKIIENQAELMKTARIVPEQENGKVTGIRLLNIRPDTLLGKLGMAQGDMLRTINGFDMTSPEKALEAYAKLRTAPQIQVGVVRNGKPVTIEYNIK